MLVHADFNGRYPTLDSFEVSEQLRDQQRRVFEVTNWAVSSCSEVNALLDAYDCNAAAKNFAKAAVRAGCAFDIARVVRARLLTAVGHVAFCTTLL